MIEYSPALADKICSQLADGVSLRTVCKADDMPNKATVFRWLRTYPDFRANYAAAKEESADAIIEEILDIADDGTNDWMPIHGEDGENAGWRLNSEHVQRSRVRIDTRKWIAGKMKPKKYGDHQHVEHSGSVGSYEAQPIPVEQRQSDTVARTNGAATNGHSA